MVPVSSDLKADTAENAIVTVTAMAADTAIRLVNTRVDRTAIRLVNTRVGRMAAARCRLLPKRLNLRKRVISSTSYCAR
jgi:hypothetical protein